MKKYSLIIGDILALLITTLIGFIAHGESVIVFFSRFLATFVPLAISWLLVSPWFGLFQTEIVTNPKQLWRVSLVMFFITPLAITVRGALLAMDVRPIFVLVFGITSAIGLCLWRGLYFLLKRKS
jgi:hypothetical protein